ncbi:putative ABC transporter permease [uncultured Clostridium sp.]|uniref:putative ABC transporter permease n=1 Tax=uncultured Clostridium sp. TaxID=59620 RepID=UPI0025DE49B0|nr:putative ABC transporter permease [uncultured Clostridium sp.]
MINLLNNNIYNIVYLFTFYSFGGWCLEVAYYFKNEKKFVNRGFLKGPFCPIYGFCIVTLILLLEPYKNNFLLLFLSAFFITSFLEYVTGFLLEKIFKTKWWDYTDDPFNIHGRVCLPYSLLWASGEVLIIKIINPVIINVICNIPEFFTILGFYFILFYFFTDFILTVLSLLDSSKFSLPFAFASINFSFDKANPILSLYKESTYRFKNIEIKFHRFRLNNRKFIRNFNNKSFEHFNLFIQNIKNKIKKY